MHFWYFHSSYLPHLRRWTYLLFSPYQMPWLCKPPLLQDLSTAYQAIFILILHLALKWDQFYSAGQSYSISCDQMIYHSWRTLYFCQNYLLVQSHYLYFLPRSSQICFKSFSLQLVSPKSSCSYNYRWCLSIGSSNREICLTFSSQRLICLW